MNLQPPRSYANGQVAVQERRVHPESKMQFGKSHSSPAVGIKAEITGNSSRDRLIYISACLIGMNVEVHVKNGLVYSGIFHTANAEKDFGIVLKMARVTANFSQKEQKNLAVKRPQTIIIPSRELVQLIVKDVACTVEGFCNGHVHEKWQDMVTDSSISRPSFIEERELERWTPEDDGPHCPGLDNIFDVGCDRKWDQFETNEVLFGVKSTFDEELYTTKLERGPQTRELEKEALRIAREIEGEKTHDLHLAEERGMDLNEDFCLDEETRFSAVYKGPDSVHPRQQDINQLGFRCDENSVVINKSSRNGKSIVSEMKSCSPQEELATFQMNTAEATIQSSNCRNENIPMDSHLLGDENRNLEIEVKTLDRENNLNEQVSNEIPVSTGIQSSIPSSSHNDVGNAAIDVAVVENKDCTEISFSVARPASVQSLNTNSRPGSSRSSCSDHVSGNSSSCGPGLSPSSSMSSEKFKLNPYAKEFKLNPNARSFTPPSTLKPQSPVPDGSFFYATNVSAVPQVPCLQVGVGIGPPYGMNQPVVYNPQAVQMQAPHAYMHPAAQQYGQQMYFAPPRPVLYMQSYPPEMPYKARDF